MAGAVVCAPSTGNGTTLSPMSKVFSAFNWSPRFLTRNVVSGACSFWLRSPLSKPCHPHKLKEQCPGETTLPREYSVLGARPKDA